VRTTADSAPEPQKPWPWVHHLPLGMWAQSDSEDLGRARAAGLRACLFNLDAPNEDWRVLRVRAGALSMGWGWWKHVHDVVELDTLLGSCVGWDTALCGINVEHELETVLPPAVVADRIRASGYAGQVFLVAYGWVQNNVRVTDKDLGRLPWLLEMFPQDAPELWVPLAKWPQCISHARDVGIRYPYQLVGCYGDARPDWWTELQVDRSLYPANAINDEWERWL